jgi:beta-phosphoglucomutase-like phosphatase (HAD superfamily)
VLLGADAALERLAGAFRLGIATSSALGPAQTVLAKTGWGRFFEVVVSADSVARGKPAPDVYLRALDLLHADPSRTAAVEDSASGLRSAHGAGLVVIGIPNHTYPRDPAALSLATKIVASLDDLTVSLFENLPKR